jgi:hypothetical protein
MTSMVLSTFSLQLIIPISEVKDADHEFPAFDYSDMKTEVGIEYNLPAPILITDLAEIEGLKCICFPTMCKEEYFWQRG